MEAQQSGMADLAARLTKRLADANSDSNLVFSPLSIYALLALLAAGARGDTLEEILRVLGAGSRTELEDSVTRLLDGPLRDTSESGGPSVAFAYGLWSDQTRPLKPAYRDTAVGTYKANASVVDFVNEPRQAKRQINAWVAEATRNLITSVVPPGPLKLDTKLVLANAVYFKGKWDMAFYESQTKNEPFYRLDGTAVEVPFMTNYSRHYVAEHDGFKVLKLRYKSSPHAPFHHCMCIFLPDALDGLGILLDKITSSSPGSFLREHLPTSTVSVGHFRVPKFLLSFESSVTAILKDLGLRLPFTLQADLSEMIEDDGSSLPLLVQDVFQAAVVEVNEEGTRAAAVTYIPSSPGYSPDPSPTVDFVADHPFAYFIIEEESHTVIFAGHVVDPSNGAGVVIPSPAPFQEYKTRRGQFEHAYSPLSPKYRPVSPTYSPSPPAYSPVYGPSFRYSPVAPVYYYQHPSFPSRPVSSAYNPSPPTYSPIPVYRPAVPFESDRVSPAAYRPTATVYTHNSPTAGVGPYRAQGVDHLSSDSQPKATATGEDELPVDNRD